MFAVIATKESAFDIIICELYYFYLPKIFMKNMYSQGLSSLTAELRKCRGNVRYVWVTFLRVVKLDPEI
jgi:hypothetical protein